MPCGLTVEIRMVPGYAIVTPARELDIATAPQLRECLLAFQAPSGGDRHDRPA